MKSLILYIFLLLAGIASAFGQHLVKGHVFDAQTKEPLPGVTILIPGTSRGTTTGPSGEFYLSIDALSDSLAISCVGYQKTCVCSQTCTCCSSHKGELRIALQPAITDLQTMVVTASRDAQPRTQVPAAISSLSTRQLEETKPTLLSEVINKVPGVLMVNLGNEQHSMSIRQPMSYRGYFLYLEDGIPIRPAGLFNHNALIEVNMFGVRTVEVVKGPASSIYGSEAIGGAVNFITQAPASVPTVRIGLHGDQWGYRRLQFNASSFLNKKLGIFIGGYYARQRNGWQDHSDFDKLSINARADYYLNGKTKLIASLSTNQLDTQTGGSLDSLGFYERKYTTLHSFTYRKVDATRARLTLQRFWNSSTETQVTAFFRANTIGQLPTYTIRNVRSDPTLAHGEVNAARFRSYGMLAQHSQSLPILQSKIIGGLLTDFTPSSYKANYIAIDRDVATGQYVNYTDRQDSLLTNYNTDLLNAAAYLQWEFSPIQALRLVAGLRYDHLGYRYDNHLPSSAFSGAPDEQNHFAFVTPKLGITYELSSQIGLYANVSGGAYAPGINELYRGVKVPSLKPARFTNYEVGGWTSLLEKKMNVEVTVYQMNGTNEIVSFVLPDNSTENRNSGKTLHQGVEYNLVYSPTKAYIFRFGGTNALHRFVEYSTTEGSDFDGNRMPNAPTWIANCEIQVKPSFLPGLRLGLEWQRISAWYTDDANQFQYADRTFLGMKGVSVLHLRAGYQFKGLEVYGNILNLTNELYAHNVTRSRWGDTFTPAAGRSVALGITYTFSGKE